MNLQNQTNESDIFETFANADQINWHGDKFDVIDTGSELSGCSGRHLRVRSADGTTHTIHERLVRLWAEKDQYVFEPIS